MNFCLFCCCFGSVLCLFTSTFNYFYLFIYHLTASYLFRLLYVLFSFSFLRVHVLCLISLSITPSGQYFYTIPSVGRTILHALHHTQAHTHTHADTIISCIFRSALFVSFVQSLPLFSLPLSLLFRPHLSSSPTALRTARQTHSPTPDGLQCSGNILVHIIHGADLFWRTFTALFTFTVIYLVYPCLCT